MIRYVRDRIDAFQNAMVGDLLPAGKAWFRVGVAVLVVAAAMSYSFGAEISTKHALFLAALTFVAAFGPEACYRMWQEHKRGSAIAIGLFCIPLLGIEFYSHAGYSAGLRGHNLAEARVQNVRFDGAQDAVKDDAANLKVWREQLVGLEAERKSLIEANPWAVSVKADALRNEIKVIDEKIASETAGGRGGRKAGCKAECEKLKDAKIAVEKRIAATEKLSEVGDRIEKLAGMIEATQRIVDRKRQAAATTEHKSSAVEHQNKFLAKAIALVGFGDLSPTEKIEHSAEQSVNLAMALAGTGLPAFCLFIAGLYRRQQRDAATEFRHLSPTPLVPAADNHTTTITVAGRDPRIDEMIARFQRFSVPNRAVS